LVRFGLSDTGTLRFVELHSSSGFDELDRAAARSIAEARFPVPPIGMTDAQRTYVVPFDFR
jgi:TonB family protein